MSDSNPTAYNEEQPYAIIYVFMDPQELRGLIEGISKDCNERNIGLITVTATTNAVFHFGIQAQDEIVIKFPGLDDYYETKTVPEFVKKLHRLAKSFSGA